MVTGQKLFRVLQQQIVEADETMYGIFNELNDDDRYDIHCRWEIPTDSHIPRHVCRPQFLTDAQSAEAKNLLDTASGYSSTTPPPVMAKMAQHYPILEKKMRALLKKSPELLKAVTHRYELQKELDSRKSQYFDKDDK